MRASSFNTTLWQWSVGLASVFAAAVVGVGIAKLADLALRRVAKRRDLDSRILADPFVRPVRALSVVLCARIALEILGVDKDYEQLVQTTTTVLCIAIAAWLFERVLHSVSELVVRGTGRNTEDPERLARRRTLRTQVVVAQRIASVLIAALGAALVALQFDVVRSVGVSLLASAGLAGVVLGFAAQRSIEALLAGLQLTFSQPIRIGDSVVIKGEFGVIEDIRLTHVAVQLWDKRRLVVPTPKFLEEPFENWSRSNTGLLGPVILRVHHHTPVDEMRAELDRILEREPLWDKQTKALQVTDSLEDSLEIRILVSSFDAGRLFDLRVAVREKMVRWLVETEEGAYLPRARWAPAAVRLMEEGEDDELSGAHRRPAGER